MTLARSCRRLLPVLMIVLAAAALPPMFDESYYWAWSKAPALAYFDHPPGIAWALAASTALFGDGILGLRFVPLVSMGLTALFSVAAVSRMVPAHRRCPARRLVVLSLLGAPMFALGYLPATPDPLQGAVVAFAAYALVRADEPRFLFLAAFTLTAGVLVKHSTLLLGAGAALFWLFGRRGRTHLRSPALWGGVFAGALCLIPWIVADRSTGFQALRVFSDRPNRGPVAIPLMIGSMMGTLGILVAPLLLWFPWTGPKGPARAQAGGAALLLAACLAAVWLGTGEANWPMPAMVFALPGLVGFVVDRPRLCRVYSVVATASAGLMMIGLLHVVVPFLPIPPAKDRTLRAAGFERVAERAEEVARRVGTDTLITRRYQIASMLRYHLQDRLTVHEMGTSRRSQYDLWPRPPICAGETAVVVLPGPKLPVELDAEPIGAPQRVERGRAGRVLDAYFVTPVRMRSDRGAEGACE